ncbi:uncharacterized protein HaLaN_16845 [Haematococcus lacustris]|uniref:Histidine kinase/HSP90-like ATPase domain-containing protein n=1 Tax=Haematococcus lacustris TaxID=44745 RepID=A0A699ZDE0_HAELA|nr:uncharacterized protein HaLaN_16845 [Haematococcus lacustris]
MTKDMTLVDKLCELLDNSLSAVAGVQTPTILLKFLDSRPDSEALLVLEDNGHGMSREVLEKALITACTFSTEHRLQRTELPVRLDQYLDCHFNRFGRGLNVVFGIGNTLVIDSRHPGTGQGHRLQASYPEWVEAFERGQHDNTFKCMSCELAPATERLEQGCTSITVSDLLPDVLATLRQPGNLQLIAAERAMM